MTDFNSAALLFEHNLRAKITQVRQHIEAATDVSHCNVRYEQGYYDGKWAINSWGNGIADQTTKGAQLDVVMEEHIRRIGAEKGMEVLPAMLGYTPPEDAAAEIGDNVDLT
jgi:hypothetical protein